MIAKFAIKYPELNRDKTKYRLFSLSPLADIFLNAGLRFPQAQRHRRQFEEQSCRNPDFASWRRKHEFSVFEE
ncbi:MAG: hypothetical protein ACJAU6_003602 [Alphaproteobacteria bacterium]